MWKILGKQGRKERINRKEKKEQIFNNKNYQHIFFSKMPNNYWIQSEPKMIDRVKDDYFHFLREGVFISLIYFRSVLAFEVGKNIVVTVLSTKKWNIDHRYYYHNHKEFFPFNIININLYKWSKTLISDILVFWQGIFLENDFWTPPPPINFVHGFDRKCLNLT